MSEQDIKAIADEMVKRYPENLNSISIEGRGFMLGATWGLERGTARFIQTRASFHELNGRLMSDNIAKSARIEELESKLKLADRNNELLRGHRDQLEAQQQNIDPEIAKVVSDNWDKLIDAQNPDDDIIPEDYYIK